jgi:arylsulfatase A-like enzyme
MPLNNRRVLIFGADGLRPDQIDPAVMPNLRKLADGGVRFADHHAAYPSHTRVNGSTFSTGRSPGQHGIVANTMLVPNARPDHIIDTGSYEHLDALGASDPRGTQLVESLSDILVRHGTRVAIAGTGSSGSNVLWTFGDRGRLVNPNSAFGIADLYDLRDKLGEVPEKTIPAVAANAYATSAVTDIYLGDESARVITLWLAEPDSSLHYTGIGSPETTASLVSVDHCLGRVLEAMESRGIRDQVDILFLSDHGHSTVRAHRTLREYLKDARKDLGSGLPELATASDYIYAKPGDADPDAAALAPLVEWLHAQEWSDVVLGGSVDATKLPGVIPMSELWNGHTNSRQPLLGVSPVWTSETNDFGVPGVVASLTTQSALKSSHGSLSPYDMHATFIANGPSFREGLTSTIPTGAVDVMPTMLSLLGIEVPDGLDGRVLGEGLLNGHEPESVTTGEANAPVPGGRERSVIVHRVDHASYVHGTHTGGEFMPATPAG